MIEWLLLPGNQLAFCQELLPRAWRGAAQVRLLQPTAQSRPITVVVPEDARALRDPRWPDVLSDWADIYEEPLFPSPRMPVAGEVLSESGDDCLALFADLGNGRCGVGWYERGALVELEQVGKAAVAWQRGQPLGRPRAPGVRAQLASLAGRLSDSARDVELYERVEAGQRATAEAVLGRALLRLLGDDPPPINELARAVVHARGGRLSL